MANDSGNCCRRWCYNRIECKKFQLYRNVQCSISRLIFRHCIACSAQYFALASPKVVRIAGVTIIFRQHRNEQATTTNFWLGWCNQQPILARFTTLPVSSFAESWFTPEFHLKWIRREGISILYSNLIIKNHRIKYKIKILISASFYKTNKLKTVYVSVYMVVYVTISNDLYSS